MPGDEPIDHDKGSAVEDDERNPPSSTELREEPIPMEELPELPPGKRHDCESR
jgi:hypothetical protein